MTDTPELAAGGPTATDIGAKAADATPASNAAKLIGPIAAIGATWGVRKVLDSAYRRSTGREPPRASDPETSISRVLLWAAVSAAALAVVNVIIDRLTANSDR